MTRFRNIVLAWLWRCCACVVAVGYLIAVAALGWLNAAPGPERLATPILVIIAAVSFTTTIAGHVVLVRVGGRWKPKRSIIALSARVVAAVMIVPLAVAFWPVTVFAFGWRRGKYLTERQRALGTAYMNLTRWGLR